MRIMKSCPIVIYIAKKNIFFLILFPEISLIDSKRKLDEPYVLSDIVNFHFYKITKTNKQTSTQKNYQVPL